MNALPFYAIEIRARDIPASESIEELGRVRLNRLFALEDGTALAPGSIGTVVSVYRFGEAFCVEFVSPFPALATLRRADIEPVAGESRGDFVAATDDASR